jgi:hypothetical protein
MTTVVPYQNTIKTVVLAKLEATEGVDAAPTAALNAMLCSAFDIKANPTVLERNNYAPTLSKDKNGIGRLPCVVTFTKELKASGTLGVKPELDALLQACGMLPTQVVAGAATQVVGAAGVTNTGPVVTLLGTTAPNGTVYDAYELLVTTGGASGTAKVLVFSPGMPNGDATRVKSLDFSKYIIASTALGDITFNLTSIVAPTLTVSGTWVAGEVLEFTWYGVLFRYVIQSGDTTNTIIATNVAALIAADARFTGTAATAAVITGALAGGAADAAITSGTPLTLGGSGAAVTLTWTGNLVAGDYYTFQVLRPGWTYYPNSFSIPSMTLYGYKDGTLHKVVGARGTFKIDGKASDYAKCSFTFTGNYVEPVDAALPTGLLFEPSRPVKCELMNFVVENLPRNYGDSWSLDIGNTVTQRDNYNALDGWSGVVITDRKPKLMADPESMAPSSYNAWKRMQYSDSVRIHAQIGRRLGVGNLVNIDAGAGQYEKADYKNRTNIQAWDMTFQLARITDAGENEFTINFG